MSLIPNLSWSVSFLGNVEICKDVDVYILLIGQNKSILYKDVILVFITYVSCIIRLINCVLYFHCVSSSVGLLVKYKWSWHPVIHVDHTQVRSVALMLLGISD